MFKSPSFRSDSSGGYHTPDEGPTRERSVQFSSTVQEHQLEDVHSHDEEDDIDKKSFRHPYFRRPKLGQGLPARVFRKYPRTYACTCGILIPVWILVLLSLLCGKFLGELESGGEMDANDAAMRRRMILKTYNDAVSDTLNSLPTFCYMLYKNGTNVTTLSDTFQQVLEESVSIGQWIDSQPNLTGNTIVNVTKFADFMDKCGKSADNYTENIQSVWFQNISVDSDGDTSLSFNWNRCMDRNTVNESNRIFSPTAQDVLDSHPDAQQQAYKDEWNFNFYALQDKYLDEYITADVNNTMVDDRLRAYNRSLFEATGRTTCTVNIAAAGWFWFTIMTTVGYGNQAPSSVGGRAMVFTAGFVCILLFGAVLATSGTIISHIVFDIVYRLRVKILLKKQVMMLIWGLLWCTWMIFMSAMFMDWAWRRLGEDVMWQDAYWFSYISTTTVGLGDFYQAPQVLFISDLLSFSLSYLFGFVLLSAFLAELGQLLAQNLPDLSEELGKRLQHVGITDRPGMVDGLDGSREPLFFDASDDQQNDNDDNDNNTTPSHTASTAGQPETSPGNTSTSNAAMNKDDGHYGVEDTA